MLSYLLFFVACITFVYAGKEYTVSGLSSGAAMAVQYHVIHSSVVKGAGVIAGSPYGCASLHITDALHACGKEPDLISIPDLITATTSAHEAGSIDATSHLANAKVWLYSGTKDSVVLPGVMQKVQTYYQNYLKSSNIQTVFNIESEHAFITNNYGNKCDFLGTPFINNCDFDAAGDLLAHLLGTLKPKVSAISNNIGKLSQLSFIPSGGPDAAAMADDAYVYTPSGCQGQSGCRVHVAFHGCDQTVPQVEDAFYAHAGYNEWAESNNIIILYPQAKITTADPKACWDWWGFTGANYATKSAVQVETISAMVDHLISSQSKKDEL